ncbi:MAG TPA: hypothetical protein VLS96_10790 [Nodosilinea sp.]|nr:hypothetical protein [Nodosilinea sp.]
MTIKTWVILLVGAVLAILAWQYNGLDQEILSASEFVLVLSCALLVYVELSYELAGQFDRWRWWTVLVIISLLVVTPLVVATKFPLGLIFALILGFALLAYIELKYKPVSQSPRWRWWAASGIISLVVVPLVLRLQWLTLIGASLVGETFMGPEPLSTVLALLAWLTGVSVSIAIAALSTTWGLRQLAAPLNLSLPQHLGRSMVVAASISVCINTALTFVAANWKYLY